MMRGVLLASSILVVACGGGGNKASAQEPAPATASNDQALSNTQPDAAPAAAPASPNAVVMAKMREFETAMCACKDSPCAQRVSDDMTKWAQEQAKKQEEPQRMTEEEQKQAVAIGTHMGECMQKAMEGNP